MKKSTMMGACVASALTAVTAVAQTYQLPNIGFENWESSKKAINWTQKNSGQKQPGEEPVSWYSSNIQYATGWIGSYSELVQEKNSDGRHYANIINKLTGQASSYIPTLGVLSLAPSWYCDEGDGANISIVKKYRQQNLKYAQNGVYGGISFVGRPDAIGATIQVDAADEAHIIAYLWKGTYSGEVPARFSESAISSWLALENLDRAIWSQIDPSIVTSETVQNVTKSDDAEIIAYCDQKYTSTFSWATIEIPLTYLSASTPTMTNVILSAGYPWDSRKITAEKSLNVDSVRYVYYSRLKSASLDGYSIDFDSNTYDYVITVAEPSQLTLPAVDYAVMSNDALTAEKTVTVTSDDDNKLISVKVANNAYAAGNTDATDVDGLGEHTYSFYFRKPSETLAGYYFTNIDGASTDVKSGEATTMTIEQNKANVNYTVTLSNVVVADGASAVNIVFPDAEITEENGVRTFTGMADAMVGGETLSVVISGKIEDDGTFEIKFSYLNASGENVAVVFTPDARTSAVKTVKDTKTYVSAASGKISVAGYTGNVEVFTIDGRMVANAACQGFADINVANGLYIVRTGNTTTKVVVK